MRVSLLVIGTIAFAATACGGEDVGGSHKGGPTAPGVDAPAAGAAGASSGPSGAQCPTDVPAPKQLAGDASATDLSFVGTSVYFRAGTSISRVDIGGAAPTKLHSSDDLVRAYADASGILTIETDTNDVTTLNLLSLEGAMPAGGAPGAPDKTGGSVLGNGAVPVDLSGASTIIAGSDTTSFYLLDDAADTFYRLDKQSLTLTPLATLEGVVSYPQIAGGFLWYVRDQKRVFQVDLSPDTQAQPTEIFGIGYDACDLAVGSAYAYCSTSGVIEQRDLTGGNPKDVLESAKSKFASPFGAALPTADGVVVRSSTGDPVLSDVIRAVAATGDERLVACGRSTISTMATDGKNVAWVDKSGLFAAQR